MTRVIGIDPGSRITGYGLIEADGNRLTHVDCGGVHVHENIPLEKRLKTIYDEISAILKKFRPDCASVEDPFFAKNARSAMMLGHVRGVVLLALTENKIPFFSYSPKVVKKAITGNGNATKEQVQFMVQQLLKLKEKAFEDASDALAAAICHGTAINLQKRLIK